MTTSRIGAVQRDILRSLRDGAKLYRSESVWWFVSVRKLRYGVNGNSCGGLAVRGLIARVGSTDRYELTDKGKKALG